MFNEYSMNLNEYSNVKELRLYYNINRAANNPYHKNKENIKTYFCLYFIEINQKYTEMSYCKTIGQNHS